MRRLFFFGSLRDREVLEIVLGRRVCDADIEDAKAHGYSTLSIATAAYPYLARRAGGIAKGIVVSGLDDIDVARLCYFEEAEYGLAPIEVETAQGLVRAEYFRATEKVLKNESEWDIAVWRRDERAVALEAAVELIAHQHITPVDKVDTIWPGIMMRARMRARAKAEKPALGTLRGDWGPKDVDVLSIERPYTRYFAIEEHRLRHRRFDGSWSPEILRTAVTSGDAVTVLPYDPRTDRVALIEQFRAPMAARGDQCPWGIEIIAGRIDAELDAETCARREAVEEAGLTIGRMEQIAGYYSSPGIAAEHITSFVAEASLAGEGGVFGLAAEAEDIRSFTVPLTKALSAVATGEINNAPAILSLLWLERHAERLREAWLA